MLGVVSKNDSLVQSDVEIAYDTWNLMFEKMSSENEENQDDILFKAMRAAEEQIVSIASTHSKDVLIKLELASRLELDHSANCLIASAMRDLVRLNNL